MREGGCSVAPTSPTVTLLLKFCLQNNFEAKSNLKTRGKQLSHPLHGLGTLLPCPCWTHPYHSTLSRLCTLSTALPRVGKALGRPRSVDLPKLPNAATPESSSSCCGDPPPTPTINLFLLLLHNCHFTTMNHNVNICVFQCLRWSLWKSHSTLPSCYYFTSDLTSLDYNCSLKLSSPGLHPFTVCSRPPTNSIVQFQSRSLPFHWHIYSWL